MGELAVICHWPPDILLPLPLEDLVWWHGLAVDTWNRMHRTED